jgi:pyruvate dehydrogenase (quinone)
VAAGHKDIPLVPPPVTIQQALNSARSRLAGDPDALSIIANGIRETVGAEARSVLGPPPKTWPCERYSRP